MDVLARFLLMARPKFETPLPPRPKMHLTEIPQNHPFQSHFKDAISSINQIATILREEDELSQTEHDWKYVAMVIDRCFLWIFVIVCIIGVTTMFVQPLGQIATSGYVFDLFRTRFDLYRLDINFSLYLGRRYNVILMLNEI